MWCVLLVALSAQAEEPTVAETEADYQAKCDQGDVWFCRELAVRYVEGDLVEIDEAATKAESLLTAACEAKDGKACTRLGTLLYEGELLSKRATKAVSLFTDGCEYEDYAACGRAAMMYYEGDGIRATPEKVHPLALRGCEGRDGTSCYALGLALQDGLNGEVDLPGAVEALGQACARLQDKTTCKLKSKLAKKL
jgi:uncharacterized protein